MSLNMTEMCKGAEHFVSHVSQHANPLVNALAHSILQDMPQMLSKNMENGLNDVGRQAIAAVAGISQDIGRA